MLAGREEPSFTAAARTVELQARARALGCWEEVFGAESLGQKAHKAYLVRWCLKGLATLRDEGVLSRQDWLAATRTLAAKWEALGRPAADHAFGSLGPAGAQGDAARGLYLLHRLFLMLDEMAEQGAIPALARDAALENLRLRAPLNALAMLLLGLASSSSGRLLAAGAAPVLAWVAFSAARRAGAGETGGFALPFAWPYLAVCLVLVGWPGKEWSGAVVSTLAGLGAALLLAPAVRAAGRDEDGAAPAAWPS